MPVWSRHILLELLYVYVRIEISALDMLHLVLKRPVPGRRGKIRVYIYVEIAVPVFYGDAVYGGGEAYEPDKNIIHVRTASGLLLF